MEFVSTGKGLSITLDVTIAQPPSHRHSETLKHIEMLE